MKAKRVFLALALFFTLSVAMPAVSYCDEVKPPAIETVIETGEKVGEEKKDDTEKPKGDNKEVIAVSIAQVIDSGLALVANWKTMSVLGIIAAIIGLLTQLIKTKLLGGWLQKSHPLWKRAIPVILGQISAVVLMVAAGTSWLGASVACLLVSGGIMAVYDVIEPLWKKWRESKTAPAPVG